MGSRNDANKKVYWVRSASLSEKDPNTNLISILPQQL